MEYNTYIYWCSMLKLNMHNSQIFVWSLPEALVFGASVKLCFVPYLQWIRILKFWDLQFLEPFECKIPFQCEIPFQVSVSKAVALKKIQFERIFSKGLRKLCVGCFEKILLRWKFLMLLLLKQKLHRKFYVLAIQRMNDITN